MLPMLLLLSVLPTSFAVGSEPHNKNADEWQGNATPSWHPTSDLRSCQLTLEPAICSYLATTSFTTSMSKKHDRKMVMSSAYVNTLTQRSTVSGMLRKTGLAPPLYAIFHWRLSDSKSPQVSWTLLSIPVVFNNAVVWMVSTRPPTSKSSRPFNNPFVIVPKAPITIGIIVTFIFHSFFQFSSKVEVLISLYTFFQFYSVVSRDSKVDNFADFLFFCWLL